MEEKVLNRKIQEDVQDKKLTKFLFQAVTFFLDGNVYALDIADIQEIIFPRKISRIPNTSEKILGVLNLRGSILPVYSLKLILGLPDLMKGKFFIDEEEKFIVILKKQKDVFGVFIDTIYKNITATEENYKTGEMIERWSKNFLFKGVILEGEKEILTIHSDTLMKTIFSLK